MLAWRVPLGLLGGVVSLRAFASGLEQLKRLEGPWAEALLAQAQGFAPEDLKAALAGLPAVPSGAGALLALSLLVPLGLAGAWLHHSVWDHGCLWLLKGVRKEHPWRCTLRAEALALQVGSVGVAFGFISLLPRVGAYLWPFVVLVDLWFWGLRGVALAAFHGCPAWKGVVATLLHGLLVLILGCGILVFLTLMVGLAA